MFLKPPCERLAEACRIRGTTSDAVCRSIGMGGRRALDVHLVGLRALDLYRVCRIADRLDVSVDWQLGAPTRWTFPTKERGPLEIRGLHSRLGRVLCSRHRGRYIEIIICHSQFSGL